MIKWQRKTFSELSNRQLYALLKLRTDVFVVEQNCPYAELDDLDHAPGVIHLMGMENNELVACARILPQGINYSLLSFGRVAVAAAHRDKGIGRLLVSEVLTLCQQVWPSEAIKIGAQCYLQRFYEQFGFTAISEEYLEDGIPHVDMQRPPTSD